MHSLVSNYIVLYLFILSKKLAAKKLHYILILKWMAQFLYNIVSRMGKIKSLFVALNETKYVIFAFMLIIL